MVGWGGGGTQHLKNHLVGSTTKLHTKNELPSLPGWPFFGGVVIVVMGLKKS